MSDRPSPDPDDDGNGDRESPGSPGRPLPPGGEWTSDGGDRNFPTALPETRGMRIGRYRLLREIGEGGFGTVWLAEQVEPVSRRVALKIIKPGMDTRQVIARFEQERQALAMMDHPNIAQVFDAGATENGRPYFAMELVRGERITTYCDRHRLSIPERLELFISVCNAVQHAHLKGIVHRDLKPSNILVARRDDGEDGPPMPTVIDFGVAKATCGNDTDQTSHTHDGQMLGTPAYMSPEQATPGLVDIDTRSDVYTLGVLLYELLTGRPPFESSEVRRSGMDEMCRLIREDDPPKPSDCIEAMSPTQIALLAGQRRIAPARFAALLKGDLDWIAVMALEKDRARRYQTANNFAADIRRYLSDEAVSACPPARRYRIGKFVRRHRTAFRTAAAVAVVMLGATLVSAWLAIRARHAEIRAVELAAREKAAREDAEEIVSFVATVLQSPEPARDGRTVTVVQLLERTAESLEVEFATQPKRRTVLQGVLARSYFALGLPKSAIPLQEKVRDYYLDADGIGSARTLTAMRDLAQYYFEAGRREEALALRQLVYDWYREVARGEGVDAITAATHLSRSYYAAGRYGEALALREEVLRRSRTLLGDRDSRTLTAMHDLGRSYFKAGRLDEALGIQQEVVNLRQEVSGPDHPATLMTVTHLARTCFELDDRARALALREEVFARRMEVNGADHPDTIEATQELAESRLAAGDAAEAVRMLERAVDWRQRIQGAAGSATLRAMRTLAEALRQDGRPADADEMLRSVVALESEDAAAAGD